MRKILITLIAALSLAAVPAYADHGGYGRGGYSGYHRGGGIPWAGVAAIGAVTGLAIMAANSRPVYSAPYYAVPTYPAPVTYAPAPSSWYYCQSSGMYYPYTNVCPEGWQAVPAR